MRRAFLVALCAVLLLSLAACGSARGGALSVTVTDNDAHERGRRAGYEEGYSEGYAAGKRDAIAVTRDGAAADYVLNTNTGKFHYPDCESVGKMAEKNKKYFAGSRDEVIEMGYTPCWNCKP